MFARLGSFAVRFRWFIICGWFLLAILLTLLAPNINDVAVSDQRAFLPASAPSLDANEVVKKYFPDRVAPSSAVIVVDAGDGNRLDAQTGAEAGAPGTDANTPGAQATQFVAALTEWLTGPDKPAAVGQVWSPLVGDEQTKASLTSSDGQVALLLTRFTAEGTEESTKQAIAAIHERLKEAPDGVKVYLTGDGPILAAYNTDSQNSLESTTWITIVLVVAILLIIYRSPVSPIIPLVTIGLAYIISRGVVALLGSGPLTISMYTNVFLIVVLFGAGTDYCLFLISRFREEMADVKDQVPAVKTTVRTIGETIASSAGTVIVGLAMMAFAELGLYNTTGPTIAIGVAIALLAGLTFTPALLTILGHFAFWPRRPEHIGERGLWHAWAGKVIGRPISRAAGAVDRVWCPWPSTGPGWRGTSTCWETYPRPTRPGRDSTFWPTHFGPGQMQPLNVVALDDARFDTPQGLANIEQTPDAAPGRPSRDHSTELHRVATRPEDAERGRPVGHAGRGGPDGIDQLRTGLAADSGSDLDLQAAAAGLTVSTDISSNSPRDTLRWSRTPATRRPPWRSSELAKLA